MIRLKMLHSQFPAFTAALSSSSIQSAIFEKFPNVFKDSLTEEPMRTDPVHIPLKPYYVPYRVTSARQIPLRFREKAEECVQELIKKKGYCPVSYSYRMVFSSFLCCEAGWQKCTNGDRLYGS